MLGVHLVACATTQGHPDPDLSPLFFRDPSAQSWVSHIPETVTLSCCLGAGPFFFVPFHFIFSLFNPSPSMPCPSPLSAPTQVCFLYVLQSICRLLFFIHVLVSFFSLTLSFWEMVVLLYVSLVPWFWLCYVVGWLAVAQSLVPFHTTFLSFGIRVGIFRYIAPKNR